ncbi:helix-turn-helix domain-containing protein [Subdoligranulum variabile]|uniref:DNA-binding helix-turn-helix protein n=1 Tax=Subdoligranulum variabile DSM 15176 TaxID=411471 RepID=D1PRI6_9FIRM|nr:helix-turn-helix transcriptional regulator [Subdoligranulum variabile]EFB74712.1 DNA-binding helix-turn-helix protein [Subdoligranulum variabile DSM 15176]UWP69384.1 helix-turn-helix transcriptional regulator [Subdoligranulum variabile]
MDIGALISQKRKQAGMTIDELSDRSGVPKGTLNKIINGITRDPQLETVKAIARALSCTLEDFDDSPKPRAISQDEYTMIERYRLLDPAGREIIDILIEKEVARLNTLRDSFTK